MVKLKVRARTVDMLGRQQIAGIPTAVHELLKNAHDAYAERVEIDYFRRTHVLVIRDDGLGMTRDQVENRWLAIGTESRLDSNQEEEHWTGPKGLSRRAIMGEKGIGRLAIAAIAPITLLLTRSIRPDGLQSLVVALVHWGLFEQPGLDISAIDIPITEFEGGTLPNRSDIEALTKGIRENLATLKAQLSPMNYEKIDEELKTLNIAPDQMDRVLNQARQEPLSLVGEGHGTTFVLVPTKNELNDDIDGGTDKDASLLEKNLLGFSNTMAGEIPAITTAFRDHGLDGEIYERIANRNFFCEDDHANADHYFKGTFDEYGQFSGTISIYQSEPINFVCNWSDGKGRLTRCGPFSTECYYIMGNKHESKLDPNTHQRMARMVEAIGGLYVYRDHIRILPYGDSDFDWLDIEKRRSKSAQDWFFSYRRLWGFVSLSHKDNGPLNEKSGREGFRQNQAYRDFRAILMNLFQRVAYEFFRPDSPQGETYWDKKKAYKSAHELVLKQKKKAKERQTELGNELELFFKRHQSGYFESTSRGISEAAARKIEEIETIEDSAMLAEAIERLDGETWAEFRELEKELSLVKQRGLSLKGQLEKDWASYQWISRELKIRLIDEARESLSRQQSEVLKQRIDATQRREAALVGLKRERDVVMKELGGLRQKTYQATEAMKKSLRQTLKSEFARMRPKVDGLLAEFVRQSAAKPTDLDSLQGVIERQFVEIRNEVAAFLDAIRRNMEDFSDDLREGHTPGETTGALEQEVIRLEEKLEFYQEFASLGMSVGILQHEFEKSANEFRGSMRDLKPWADGTPALKAVYLQMRRSFDHLDQYLKVLDPLGRRLNRARLTLSGDSIRAYLRKIFGSSLEKDGINLESTNAFNDHEVTCYHAPLLAAFVNILDNAIYWVSHSAKGEKVIRLDVDDQGFLISNTGQGIEDRYRDRIFEFGETTKPGGRGMGLAISREALEREGFTLELVRYGRDVYPVFRIKALPEDEREENDNDS